MKSRAYQIFRQLCKEKNYITENTKVLVACSGGPDSMALLHFFEVLQGELLFSLGACVVDHQLRPSSAKEAKMVQEYCESRAIPCWAVAIEPKAYSETEGLTLEEAARLLRYQVLRDIKEKEGFTYIALGHHKNDQAETVLAHLLRGSGLAGLRGMKTLGEDLFRPLLGIEKKDLLSYVKQEGIPYVIDESNLDSIYSRNKLRLEVIPYLEELNPSLQDNLCQMAKNINAEENYLEKLGQEAFEKVLLERIYEEGEPGAKDKALEERSYEKTKALKAYSINRHKLKHLPKALRYRVFKAMIMPFLQKGSPTAKQIEEMEKLLFKGGESKLSIQKVQVRFGYDTIKSGWQFWLDKEDSPQSLCIHWSEVEVKALPKTKEIGYVLLPLSWKNKKIAVRHRKEGDRICLFSKDKALVGHKKIKDYLIDKKVPRSQRDKLWWLEVDGELICEVEPKMKRSFIGREDKGCLLGKVEEDKNHA